MPVGMRVAGERPESYGVQVDVVRGQPVMATGGRPSQLRRRLRARFPGHVRETSPSGVPGSRRGFPGHALEASVPPLPEPLGSFPRPGPGTTLERTNLYFIIETVY